MLGTDIAAACRANSIPVRILDLPRFDISNPAQLNENITGDEVIINCAAYTNVEKAESQPELAHKINAVATGQLGQIAKVKNAHVIHISTDFIFDGNADHPYTETDPPNAISEYGKSKLAGEQLLTASGCKNCIIRIEWTYGSAGNNFISKILELARSRDSLKVVGDQIGSPTATTDVAAAIVELISKDQLPQGIFHYAAADYASRYDVARFIIDTLELNVDLTACNSDQFPSAAKRPPSSRFNCQKIQTLLSTPIKPWQDPLREFLLNT